MDTDAASETLVKTDTQASIKDPAGECHQESSPTKPSQAPTGLLEGRPAHGPLNKLALSLRARYQRTGQLSDLNRAIELYEQALDLTPKGHSSRAGRLNNLGLALTDRFRYTEQTSDLDQAIQYLQQGLDDTDRDNPRWAARMGNLGTVLHERFIWANEPSDIESALRCYLQALDATPDDDIACASRLNTAGTGYQDLFGLKSELSDLDSAIIHYQRAVDATSDENPQRAMRLANLASGLRTRFEWTGDLPDVRQAIQYYSEALACTPDGHSRQRELYRRLGIAFCALFRRNRQIVDVEQAIQYFIKALDVTPNDHSDRPSRLGDLGTCFGEKFERSGILDDLVQAIEYHQASLDATPLDHPKRGRRLGDLAYVIHQRFERLGDMSDLDLSIQYYRQALDATPNDIQERALQTNNLGVVLLDRFEQRGQFTDVEQAIQLYQDVLATLPKDHPNRADWLNNLAGVYLSAYERTKELPHLNRAIQEYEAALSIIPDDDPQRALQLSNLGVAFTDRFGETREESDLTKAIRCHEQALDATPLDHSDRAKRWRSLGAVYSERGHHTKQQADIQLAITTFEKALHAIPSNHPERVDILSRLVSAIRYRNFQTGETDIDEDRCRELLEEAFTIPSAHPADRIAIGRKLIDTFIASKDWVGSKRVIDEMLPLIARTVPRAGVRADMESVLKKNSGIAALSAFAYLRGGEPPAQALEVLEKGRGLIASFMLETISDISELKEQHHGLWSRYKQCMRQIAQANAESKGPSKTEMKFQFKDENYERGRLYQTMDALQKEIREQPGFDRFLLSPTESEIRALATNGPIVCFNVTHYSSEAILITPEEIKALDLPNLKYWQVSRQGRRLASSGNPARRDASLVEETAEKPYKTYPTTSAVMKSLWLNAVKPILSHLGLLGNKTRSQKNLPRICWVGAGVMSYMPLHAAGDHTPGSTENTISHVISSYALSLKSLQTFSGKPSFPANRGHVKTLVVAMPNTPGNHKHLQVDTEALAIAENPSLNVSLLQNPAKSSVLEALATCTIAHFACHGAADEAQPSKSALLLGKYTLEKLTVEDIEKVNCENAKIAYLSACSTAEMRQQELIDESIHLASTFHLIGFQHVIGTLWGADDNAAVEIAVGFYQELFKEDDNGSRSVAHALHNAVVRYREKGGSYTDISKWAPFVHFGW